MSREAEGEGAADLDKRNVAVKLREAIGRGDKTRERSEPDQTSPHGGSERSRSGSGERSGEPGKSGFDGTAFAVLLLRMQPVAEAGLFPAGAERIAESEALPDGDSPAWASDTRTLWRGRG